MVVGAIGHRAAHYGGAGIATSCHAGEPVWKTSGTDDTRTLSRRPLRRDVVPYPMVNAWTTSGIAVGTDRPDPGLGPKFRSVSNASL